MQSRTSSKQTDQRSHEHDFRAALGLLRRGERHKALAILSDIRKAGTTNPMHLSYLGLTLGLTGGDNREAVELCREALVLGFLETEVYLNLSRLYSLQRRHEDALRTLRQGIRALPGDRRILAQLERLNPRRPAAFSVVSRDHWLNNAVGKMQRKRTSTGTAAERARKSDKPKPGRRFGPSIPSPTG